MHQEGEHPYVMDTIEDVVTCRWRSVTDFANQATGQSGNPFPDGVVSEAEVLLFFSRFLYVVQEGYEVV